MIGRAYKVGGGFLGELSVLKRVVKMEGYGIFFQDKDPKKERVGREGFKKSPIRTFETYRTPSRIRARRRRVSPRRKVEGGRHQRGMTCSEVPFFLFLKNYGKVCRR